MASSRIVELASSIQQNTEKVNQYFSSHNTPTPSFDIETPLERNLPDEISACQQAILEATDELHLRILGPVQTINWLRMIGSPVLQAIYRFKLAFTFPIGETATFSEIAQKSGRPELEVKRIVRSAITYHLFKEPEAGVVAHTAATKALVEKPLLTAQTGMILEEFGVTMARLVDSMTKWPGSQEPTQAAFNLAHNVPHPAYEEIGKYPERSSRVKDAMLYLQTAPGFEASHVIDSFDWNLLGNGTIVDVGGSHGVVAIELARKFPSLRFVVEDRAEVIVECSRQVPKDVADRVKFIAHDFFTEQPVKNADVYFFRCIFHNWADQFCVKILKALIPALKAGARVLVQDVLLPEPGTMSAYQERKLRTSDLYMMGLANARERDWSDWVNLLKVTDPAFVLKGHKTPPTSEYTLIEIIWEGPPK